MDEAEILSRVSLFSLMKKRDLKRIARQAKHHSIKKGDVVIREGDRDGRLFVIISGEVEVIKGLGSRDERGLGIFRSNNYFGEMALLDDYVRTASVRAREDTELLSLDQWNIRDEIKRYPSIAIELLQILARRLRVAEQREDKGSHGSGGEEGVMEFQIRPIGRVRSPFDDPAQCPYQEHEGAAQAWIEVESQYAGALDGLEVGDEILVLSWMHLGDRSILRVRPRRNPENPLRGVFATRSPNRPNPIGVHKTRILAIEAPSRILVESLELLDGTPVVDIKPVIGKGGRPANQG